MHDKDLYLVYIECGGEMEDPDHYYVGHRLCRGNTEEEVLKDYAKQHNDIDVEKGSWYGRPIRMTKVPEVSCNKYWNKIAVVEILVHN